MIIDESAIIIAPIEKVWTTFIDLTCWADWNSVLTDIPPEHERLRQGESFVCSVRPYVFPIYFEPKVEEMIPLQQIIWTSRKFGITSHHLFSFRQEGAGVRVRSYEVLTGVMMLLAGWTIPKSKLREMNQTFLRDLKQKAENVNSVRPEENGGK